MSADAEAAAESRYEVREVIGKGAFGEVNLVVEKQSKQRYVLKRIKMARQSEWQRKATRQEIEIVSRLRHPFIMPYKEHWIHHGHTINVVYGYCEKGDLSSAITKQRGKPFPEETLRLWLAELLLAVEYMHRQNVLHRDIKTPNILLTGDGDVQIGDFGLATVRVHGDVIQLDLGSSGGADDSSDTRPDASGSSDNSHGGSAGTPERPHPAHLHANAHLPQAGNDGDKDRDKDQAGGHTPVHDKVGTRNDYALVGTPHFMSPELLSSQKYSYETDIWSLGVVMYELTTLKPPFNAFNLAGLVAKIKRAALPPIPTTYSADWASVLKSMLRKDPTRRAGALEILTMPSMQPALQQARQRALVIAPDTVFPDIPYSEPSPAPSEGGFCFDVPGGAAASHRTPSAGGGMSTTPVLVCPDEGGSLKAETSSEGAEASPMPKFPDLESEPSGASAKAPSSNVTPRRARANTVPNVHLAGAGAGAGAAAAHEGCRAKTPVGSRRTAATTATPTAAAKRHPTPQAAGAGTARSRTPARAAEDATAPTHTPGRMVRKASLPRTRPIATPSATATPAPSVPATPRDEASVAAGHGHAAAAPERPVSRLRTESLTGGASRHPTPLSARCTSSSRRATTDSTPSPTGATAAAAGAAPIPLLVSPIAVPSPVTTPNGDTDAEAVTPDAHAAAGVAGKFGSAPPTATATTPTSGPRAHHKLPPGGTAASTAASSGRTRDSSACRTTRASSFSSARPTRTGSGASAASPGGVAAGVAAASPTSARRTSAATTAAATTADCPGTGAGGASGRSMSANPITRRRSQPGNALSKESSREGSEGAALSTRPTPERRVRRTSYVSHNKPSGSDVAHRKPAGVPLPASPAPAAATTSVKARSPRAAAAPAAAAESSVEHIGLLASHPIVDSDTGNGSSTGTSAVASAITSAVTSAGGSSSCTESVPVVPPSGEPSAATVDLPAIASEASKLSVCSAASVDASRAAVAGRAVAERPGIPLPPMGASPPVSGGGAAGSVFNHSWMSAPRSQCSLMSVTTEDSELSIPDGRYATPEGSTGGGLLDGEASSGVGAQPGAVPLWNSNQLYSGSYGSFGGAMSESAAAAAAAAGAAGASLGGARSSELGGLASASPSGTLTVDLPRRVSISVFAPALGAGNNINNGSAAGPDAPAASSPSAAAPSVLQHPDDDRKQHAASEEPEGKASPHSSSAGGAAGDEATTASEQARGSVSVADADEVASSSLSGGGDLGGELGTLSESVSTGAASSPSASSPSVFGPSPAGSPSNPAAAGATAAATAAAANAAAAATRRRQTQDRISPRSTSSSQVPQLRSARSLDARGSSGGSAAQGLSPRLSPRISPRTALLAEPSSGGCSMASTASAQRSFAGFVIHQPPSPSGWRIGANGSPMSMAESAGSSTDATSPLRPVAEGEEGLLRDEEAQSAPPPAVAAAADGAMGVAGSRAERLRNHAVYSLSSSEREQLVLLQRVVGIASSLWEAGRHEELGAVLSSTLSRSLVRSASAAAAAVAVVFADVEEHPQSGSTLPELGDTVRVLVGPLRGVEAVVRYRGPCHWGAGVVVGVELPPGTTENADASLPTGVRDGVTYFRCQSAAHRAAFLPLDHVALLG